MTIARHAPSLLLLAALSQSLPAESGIAAEATTNRSSDQLAANGLPTYRLSAMVTGLPDGPASAADEPFPSILSSSPAAASDALDPQVSGAVVLLTPAATQIPYASSLSLSEKWRLFIKEQFNPALVIGPAVGAAFTMANPPGKGSTRYPHEWTQGGAAFGRNYGDGLAQVTAAVTGKFISAVLLHEDPRYFRSSSTNVLKRTFDAARFTVVNRSNSGKRRLALSNFIGAAAGGFVGNAYLPPGFRSSAHAEQRSLVTLAGFAGQNVLIEYSPEIRAVAKKFHIPFIPK